MKRSFGVTWLFLVCAIIAGIALPQAGAAEPAAGEKKGPFGRDTVISFYGDYRKDVPSQNLVLGGETWFKLLQGTVEQGAEVLATHPHEPFSIDELGFDFDGPADLKTIKVLTLAKEKKPELKLAVWQMRGPVAPKLAAAYRELVELVMMETYVDLPDSWWIAFNLQTANLSGLADKTIIGLGVGAQTPSAGEGPQGGYFWTKSKEDLEQQIRLIRYVAPDSPGVTFFGQKPHFARGKKGVTITLADVEAVVSKFRETPTDGTGLTPELLELGKTFTKRYEKPAIFCSSALAYAEAYPGDPGTDWRGLKDTEPLTIRALMMNLGEQDAKNVIVRIRHRGEGGEVWAKGVVDIPARSIAVAVLPAIPGSEIKKRADGRVEAVGKCIMEVDVPSDWVVEKFRYSRYWE
jgi:hypothetical protein